MRLYRDKFLIRYAPYHVLYTNIGRFAWVLFYIFLYYFIDDFL